jgi:hypothetical protein
MKAELMSKPMARFAGALALLVAGSAGPLVAQGQETAAAAHHRAECRLAAQVLRTGEPHTKRSWAVGYVANCSDEGPAVLAEQWRNRGSEHLEELVRASGRIRDARLYGQLRQTAADRSQPAAVRAGAMLVLARYVDPGSAVWLTDLVPPDSIRRVPLIGASTTATGQLTGAQPLDAPVSAQVLALLESIAAARAEEPREVWYAAAVLARRVRSDINLGRGH